MSQITGGSLDVLINNAAYQAPEDRFIGLTDLYAPIFPLTVTIEFSCMSSQSERRRACEDHGQVLYHERLRTYPYDQRFPPPSPQGRIEEGHDDVFHPRPMRRYATERVYGSCSIQYQQNHAGDGKCQIRV